MWKLKPDGKNGIGMFAAQGSIILWDQGEELESGGTMLTVLDSETGGSKWKMKLDKDAKVINKGMDDPVVLIRDSKRLRALNPDTGTESWNIESQGDMMEDPSYSPYYAGDRRVDPFKEQGSKRWILLGDKWRLLDTKTGQSKAEYPAIPQELFEVLDHDQRYMLIQKSLDDKPYWEARLFETVLYDAFTKRELWKMDGKGSKGLIDGQNLYLSVNGRLSAVKFDTGELLWQMSTTASMDVDLSSFAAGSYIAFGNDLLYPYGSDLLVIHKQDGTVRGRILNMTMGYAELRDLYIRNGTLNVSGDELYAGSANGGFSRFSIANIEEWLEQL
ncbi:outer membrane biogenesis protein BamB [compost metagenome]